GPEDEGQDRERAHRADQGLAEYARPAVAATAGQGVLTRHTDMGALWRGGLRGVPDRRRQQLLRRRRVEPVEHERVGTAVVAGPERLVPGVRLVDDPHAGDRALDRR